MQLRRTIRRMFRLLPLDDKIGKTYHHNCSKFVVELLTSIRLHHIETQATACVLLFEHVYELYSACLARSSFKYCQTELSRQLLFDGAETNFRLARQIYFCR